MVTTYNTLAELVAALDATFISAETKAIIVAKAIDSRVVCDGKPSFSLFEEFTYAVSVPIFDGMMPYVSATRTELKNLGIVTNVHGDRLIVYFNYMPTGDELALIGVTFGTKVMELYKDARSK